MFVYLCVCVCIWEREKVGEGAVLVLLSQLIAVLQRAPALPLSPEDSGAFRWAYLSTHKPWHSQAIVCGAESPSASSQSVSIRDVLTDRHTAVAFVFHSRHSLPPIFFFFHWTTKRHHKIIDCSVHKNVPLKVKIHSYFETFPGFPIWLVWPV